MKNKLEYPFGDLLRGYRQRERMTQTELARRLHVTRLTIYNWEVGNYLPKRYQAEDIARALHLREEDENSLLLHLTGPHIRFQEDQLDEVDKGTFLHLYVPNGRFQEDQLASFLRLFESYLQHIEKLPFFIDTRKTLHGQIYEFKSKNNAVNLTDIEAAFSRFENFMSLSQNDLKSAENLLLRAGITPSEAARLLTKYMKEYRRLLLDIGHERERKLLDLRQRLESEAFEQANSTGLGISQPAKPTALLSLSNIDPLNITISNSSVNINSGIQSFIEQEIQGDIHYTNEDRELLHLFEEHTERLEAIQLRSELEELKDTSLPEVERKSAMQKITEFLYKKAAPAIGQSALTILTAYLQKVLTGS